jgi:hypothetical protein
MGIMISHPIEKVKRPVKNISHSTPKFFEVSNFGLLTSRNSLTDRGEKTQMDKLAIRHDMCSPLIVCLRPADTSDTRRAILTKTSISVILLMCSFSEVG